MPIFEYRCDRCQAAFEELVFSDTSVTCPSCHHSAVTRQLSVPARPMAKASLPPSCESGLPPSSCCGGGCQPN